MNIKNILIMSAGFGTRMGEIGKELPKVLWPIFEIPMLELQILLARKRGIENIYVNLHHQHEAIEKHITLANYENVHVVYEPEILGVGGAVHNIKRKFELTGNLLIINSDMFYFFADQYYEEALTGMSACSAHIFLVAVNEKGYNETVIKNNCLVEIKNTNKTKFNTYSGVSIINLNKLENVDGPSDFFTSVANYKLGKVRATIPKNYECLDFGTSDRYFHSMFEIIEGKRNKMFELLSDLNAMDHSKIGAMKSYGTNVNNSILLDANGLAKENSIVIKGVCQDCNAAGIYYNSLFSSIS